MRDYGKIQSAIWSHQDFVSLSVEGKLLVTYLLTGPHANGTGCYYLPDGYIMADLDMVSDTLSDTLSEVERKGFLKRCNATKYVFIPKFLKWNPVASGKVCVARLKEIQSIPSRFSYITELKEDFDKYVTYKSEDYDRVWNRVSDTVCHTRTEQNRTEQNVNGSSGKPNEPGAELLESLWKIYPKRSGSNPKKRAGQALNARLREGVDPDAIRAGLERYVAWCEATDKVGTETVMQAARFFGPGREWENDWAAPGKAIKLPRDNQTLWAIRSALKLPFEYETTEKCHAEIRDHLRKHPEQREVVEGMV